MDFFYILMPISGFMLFWPGLIILGFGVGILGAFFGLGGAWMVTPGLNMLGFPMAFAIGTDIAHMAGKCLVSTMRHGKFGNVDYPLGLIMLAGTVMGFEVGAQAVMLLERMGNINTVVRWIYVVLLSFITWMVFYDLHKRIQKDKAIAAAGGQVSDMSTGLDWAATMQKLPIPPIMNFKQAGIRMSIWVPVLVSFLTGVLAGILGIGGGLLRMPALIYLIGCPTHVAVGTDLFEVMISGLYGAGSYTYKGRTELVAALIMLVGAAIGAQIGAIATKYVKGYGIRIAFGICVIACGVSIAMRLAQPLLPGLTTFLDVGSTVVILGTVSVVALYVFMRMVQGVMHELAMIKAGKAQS
jgi:uncharacterized membrane protein YfcA